jgi:hypothetical protein
VERLTFCQEKGKIKAEQIGGGNRSRAIKTTDKDVYKERTMKVLAIGNSFSDDSTEYVFPVLQALGAEDLSLGNLHIGGCSLQRHANNIQNNTPDYDFRTNTKNQWETVSEYPLEPALCSQAWEVVSLQQASHDSGLQETYQPLAQIIAFIREKLPYGVKLAWNMTWAYQQDSTHEGFANYGKEQKKMYEAILAAVQNCVLPTNEFALLYPVGTAVQNARTSYLGDTLTRDGFHMSIPLGRYIAALTWGRVLTGKSVENIAYAPEGVSEQEKAVAIESVENAVKNPFEVTQSKIL